MAQETLDKAKEAYEQAKAAVETAKDNKTDTARQAKSSVSQAKTFLENARSNQTKSIKEAQKQVDEAQKAVEKCIVTAPIDGVVTALNAAVGDTYTGGTIAEVEDDSRYTITSSVDEYDISDVKKGQRVVVLTEATDEDELEGVVTIVAPSTGALDSETSRKVMDIFHRLHQEQGKTIVLVSDKLVETLYDGDDKGALWQKLSMNINGNYQDFYIVGIYRYESTGNVSDSLEDVTTNAYIPLSTAKKIMRSDDGYTQFTIVTDTSVSSVSSFAEQIETFFDQYYRNNEDYEIATSTMESMTESMSSMVQTVSLAISLIAGISSWVFSYGTGGSYYYGGSILDGCGSIFWILSGKQGGKAGSHRSITI